MHRFSGVGNAMQVAVRRILKASISKIYQTLYSRTTYLMKRKPFITFRHGNRLQLEKAPALIAPQVQEPKPHKHKQPLRPQPTKFIRSASVAKEAPAQPYFRKPISEAEIIAVNSGGAENWQLYAHRGIHIAGWK